MVECAGLEIRCTACPYRGFESHPVRFVPKISTPATLPQSGAPAPFVAWEFTRDGVGAPNDSNTVVHFHTEPGDGTASIAPPEFALVFLAQVRVVTIVGEDYRRNRSGSAELF